MRRHRWLVETQRIDFRSWNWYVQFVHFFDFLTGRWLFPDHPTSIGRGINHFNIMLTRFLIFQMDFCLSLRCTMFLISQRDLPLAIGYTNFYCPKRLKMSTPSIFCTNTPYLVSFYKNKVSSRHHKSSRLSGFLESLEFVWNFFSFPDIPNTRCHPRPIFCQW